MNLETVLGGGIGAAIVSAFSAVLMWLLNRKSQKEERNNCMVAGLRMILYDRIKHLAKTYISQNEITMEDLEDILQMHHIYHDDLDGNGFLDSLINQVKTLQMKK